MKPMIPLAMLLALAACPVVARDYNSPSQPQTTEPPAGSYKGYDESRDLPLSQQTAEVPSYPRGAHPHPGTLERLNSNSGYGPEVEFEAERRQAERNKIH
ncbi:MAG TPA: hypothetical protein VL974_07465 [Magnetospirillum sp.]|jgi:hypothetical protein|nr:hypothetical protein [Magnetospirillum sp.]